MLEESVGHIQENEESNEEQLDKIKDAVTCMLREVPQTTSIESRFESIEDSLKQVGSLPSMDNRSICFENVSTVEIANELDDRQRRKGNLILHNVPETENQGEDEVTVSSILTQVLGKEIHIPNEDERVRIYRLGRLGSLVRLDLSSAI